MAYAQTSYPQKQGINGRYTIHDIGCFLTAFCNLLTLRYGHDVNPLTLNAFFVNSGRYVDIDDGVRDDLDWGSIGYFDGNIKVTRLVNRGTSQTAGLPDTNQAILKFYYYSDRLQAFTTHFALYDGDGYIIDSWDGKRKHINATIYGNPVAFAEYVLNVPQPQAPPAPPSPTYEVVENYPGGKEIVLNKQPTNLWGMNYREFQYMSEHPVESHNPGEHWIVTNKVRHVNGHYYYRRDGQVDGFNVLDCDDYVAPVPVPEPVKSPVGGLPPVEMPLAPKIKLVVTVMAFDTSSGAEQHRGVANPIGPGEYFVHEKKGIAWRLSDDNRLDKPWWINTTDNTEEAAPAEPELEPTIEPEIVSENPISDTDTADVSQPEPEVPPFKLVLHYLDNKKAVKFRAINQVPVEVLDFVSNKKAVMAEYNKVEGIIKPVPVVAWFLGPDGQKYYLAEQVYANGQAYGIRHDLLIELKKRNILDFNQDGRIGVDDLVDGMSYVATNGKRAYEAAEKFFQDARKVDHKLNISDRTVNTFHGVKQKVIDGIQFRGKVKK
jgi:hypothetical protein